MTIKHEFGSTVGQLIELDEGTAHHIVAEHFDGALDKAYLMEGYEVLATVVGDLFVAGKNAWLVVGLKKDFETSGLGSSFAISTKVDLTADEKNAIDEVVRILDVKPVEPGVVMFHSVY